MVVGIEVSQGSDALIAYPFDREHVSYGTFVQHFDTARHFQTLNEPDRFVWNAYQGYKVLMGISGNAVPGRCRTGMPTGVQGSRPRRWCVPSVERSHRAQPR